MQGTRPHYSSVLTAAVYGALTAVDDRKVPSTAVDHDQTCANAGGGGLKNLTLKACYTGVYGVLAARFLRPSPAFAHD